MTSLMLVLRHPSISAALPFGAIAKVSWAARLDGKRPAERWATEKAIGVGDTNATRFDLPAGGFYSVDVVRPRGAVISAEYKLDDGETRMERVDLEMSPHEYLSWQQFAGIVAQHVDVPTGLEPEVAAFRARRSGRLLSIGSPTKPDIYAAEIPSDAEAWDDILRSGKEMIDTIKDGLASPPPTLSRNPFLRDDGRYATWDLPSLDATVLGQLRDWTCGRRELAPIVPRWVYTAVDDVVHLVSLPWTWWLEPPIADPCIQLLHDRFPGFGPSGELPTRTTVAVHDERWFPLLEFLATGHLVEAAAIVDKVVTMSELIDALYLKRKGPLLAVAAAIVLIARGPESSDQEWDPWIANLACWFPRIPDGEILLGCRKLQKARDRKGALDALRHLQTGFERGVPAMSATIQMLSLSLAQLCGDFEQADTLRRRVAPVASRVDPEQPFVVIRV